uniref:toll/interleukin-1 receptor domain-containing protein n=1 Tax=Liquorilactobacillus sicerae TaxID=1416943 RepID=UPI0024816846
LQYTEPFMSSDDIARGDDWNNKINGELNNSRIGILFITPENINSNWLNFEAGALFSWKNKDEQQGMVMPVMINSLDITSVLSKSPLKQFQ